MPNRLAQEPSPYLRQHSQQPVDWYPWGDEAFARAAAEDRPILLSVGYAACHWCHVMAHESFEDARLAGLCNAQFVSVKVDREERPEVDALYQGICQAVTGQGGWPLTVFLTPAGEPFYVGTYFPPVSRYGRPGFGDVLAAVARAWRDDRPRVREVAAEWAALVRRLQAVQGGGAGAAGGPERASFLAAADAIAGQVDPVAGGFGGGPKFPHTSAMEVLLRAGGSAAARAVFSLRAMAAGGIHDHLGGGFHRYSVDGRWAVPHFEKMLYDNALLAQVYLAAYQRTAAADLGDVVRDTLGYLLDRMRGPEGAFFSTEDADSPDADGHPAEGAFYTWTPDEVAAAVGEADLARAACEHFGVRPGGDIEGGRSVLRLGSVEMDPADRPRVLAALRAARERRPRPARDEKVLAGWNGLAISAFARAGRVLEEPRFTAAATAAASFVLDRLRTADGGLLRRHPAGPQALPGTLEDYAYLAGGLLDLYEATLDGSWLGAAADLARQAVRRFWDGEARAFCLSEAGSPHLLDRPRDDGDGGTPSPQSALVLVLVRLRGLGGDEAWAPLPDAVLDRCAPLLRQHPLGLASLLCVLDALTDPLEVVLALPDGAEPPRDWRRGLAARYLPNLQLSAVGPVPPGLGGHPAAWEGRAPVAGRPTLWVCRAGVCSAPAHDWAEVEGLLP